MFSVIIFLRQFVFIYHRSVPFLPTKSQLVVVTLALSLGKHPVGLHTSINKDVLIIFRQ